MSISREEVRAELRKIMENTRTNRSNGIGFFGLLFILFLGLKLTNVINWSWWWVTAPLWAPIPAIIAILIALTIILFLVFITFYGITALFSKK